MTVFQVYKLYGNILNTQQQTADKGRPSIFCVGEDKTRQFTYIIVSWNNLTFSDSEYSIQNVGVQNGVWQHSNPPFTPRLRKRIVFTNIPTAKTAYTVLLIGGGKKLCTRWFKYDRDKLWLVYTQIVPVIFEPPCISCIWCLMEFA
jgi:hypothetical protein